MTNKLNNASFHCYNAWISTCSAVRRFRDDERGGIEKVVAIAIVVLITATALAAITAVVQDWVDDVPDPAGNGGKYTVD